MAGKSKAINNPIMAMTTSSSISVKARRRMAESSVLPKKSRVIANR
jgi:hypothetical protein